jgi:nicotinamidase-related amidase
MATSNKLKLTPNKTALVVIDLQNGIVTRDLFPYTSKEVIQNATSLAKAFRKAGSFVVLVHVGSKDGKDSLNPISEAPRPTGWNMAPNWSDIVSDLDVQPTDHIILKHQWGAFYGTDLDLQLRRRGIDTIVLCGISTNIGVETTAREAYQHGYNQVFAEDAMSAMEKEEHEMTVKSIFPRIGIVRKSAEIVEILK